MPLGELPELARVKIGGAFDPGIERIRSDGVELLLGSCEEMPGIVHFDVDFGIANHVVVVVSEVFRDDARDERLDFRDRQMLDPGIDARRAGRHASTAGNHQDIARVYWDQRGQMPEHALEPHVLR